MSEAVELNRHTGEVREFPDSGSALHLPETSRFDLTLCAATYEDPRPALEGFARSVARRRIHWQEDLQGVAVSENDPEDTGSLLWAGLMVPDEIKQLDSLGLHTWIGATDLTDTARYAFGPPPLFDWSYVDSPAFKWTLDHSLPESPSSKWRREGVIDLGDLTARAAQRRVENEMDALRGFLDFHDSPGPAVRSWLDRLRSWYGHASRERLKREASERVDGLPATARAA